MGGVSCASPPAQVRGAPARGTPEAALLSGVFTHGPLFLPPGWLGSPPNPASPCLPEGSLGPPPPEQTRPFVRVRVLDRCDAWGAPNPGGGAAHSGCRPEDGCAGVLLNRDVPAENSHPPCGPGLWGARRLLPPPRAGPAAWAVHASVSPSVNRGGVAACSQNGWEGEGGGLGPCAQEEGAAIL